jgi:hypothetical protein
MDPALSVIVPIRGRRRELRSLVASLACQRQPPGGIELIVAENHRPVHRVWLAEQTWPFPVRHVFVPDGSPARNRNAGAAAAAGARLFFVDSDVELPGDADVLGTMATGVPGGRADNLLMADVKPRRTAPQSLASHLYDVPAYFRTRFRQAAWNGSLGFRTFVSCAFSVSRTAFDRLNGFDERFVTYGYEDVEFGLRAEAAGLGFALAPEAVRHSKQLGPASVLARATHLGRSAVHFARLHPDIEDRLPLGVRDVRTGRLHFAEEFDVRYLLARTQAVERRIRRLRGAPGQRAAAAAVDEGRRLYGLLSLYGRYRGISTELREGTK